MARKWVRLGGKTGSHVTLAEDYSKAISRLHIPVITISDGTTKVNQKKQKIWKKLAKSVNSSPF